MQKKIIALAIAAAFSAPVVAMADATIYGSVEAGYGSQTFDSGTAKTETGMTSGVYASNNIGVKGSEDLGDGMKANFGFESGFNTATGASGDTASTYDRGIYVGVGAGWGTVTLGGNVYSTSFKVNKAWDPMGYKYVGVTLMPLLATGNKGRNDNDVNYNGKFGDVEVTVGKTFNPSVDGQSVGNASSVGAVYKSGPITAAASYTTTEKTTASTAVTVTPGSTLGNYPAYTAANANVNTSIGGAFNFGDGSVNVGYISSKDDGATDAMVTTVIGASFNVSNKVGVAAGLYKTNTGSVENRTLTLVSATYALSKKTTAYFDYNSSAANAGVNKISGYGVGLQTAF